MSIVSDELTEKEEQQVVDEAVNDPAVATVQYDISSYGADYDVEGLVKRLDRDDILVPTFQRNYVWNIKEASRFIESLLLGLPIPAIFLVREKNSNKLLVIDGQQRLKTLQFFYNGVFNPTGEEGKGQPFKLVSVQPRFEGLTYKTLDERDRIKLNDSIIHAIIVKQESPKDDDTSVYHIFERLNSQGRSLTPQEIRTAIDHGPFIDMVKALNEYENWRNIFGPKNSRLKDQELILRFIALYFEGSNYKRPMNEFLNRFTNDHRDPGNTFIIEAHSLFKSTIDIVWESIGKNAFRPIGSLNAAVFDSVMVGIARRLHNGPIEHLEKVREAYQELLADAEYFKLISRSTSDESNVDSRLQLSTQRFAEV